MTVGSGCLCSIPLPLLVSSSPAFYGDLVSPQPHPLSALGLVGSWILLDLSFLVWEGLAHTQAGELRSRVGREVTCLSAAVPRALQARWKPNTSKRLVWICVFLSIWSVPYSSPPQTQSSCPGSRWGSQHPEWSPPSSPGTVACRPAAAASGCQG